MTQRQLRAVDLAGELHRETAGRRWHSGAAALCALAPLGALVWVAAPAGARTSARGAVSAHDQARFVRAATTPHDLSVTPVWTQTLDDAGAPIALSSPNVANLDGQPSVVVGDVAGNVYAFHLADGSPVAGWPFNAGAPVQSTPSVAPLGPGGLDDVYVGTGSAGSPTSGGYQAISPSGHDLWFVHPADPPTDPSPYSAVQASMAVGTLQSGQTDVTAGSLGQTQYAMTASNGGVLAGFPWFAGDSNFSTPAIADVLRNGANQIVEGGDSTAGLAYGTTYQNGGHIRVLSPTGNAGLPQPNDGLICQYDTDQTVESSPAVGEFVGNSATVGAVVGTSIPSAYPPSEAPQTTSHLLAIDALNCSLLWNQPLDGYTYSSPALADVLGNGQLQVVEGTDNGSGGGSVWVLNGANGAPIWHQAASGEIIGSIVTADLLGAGYQDLLVPTTDGVQLLDGRTGALLGTLAQNVGFQNAPLVTDDPNGTIGITVAGYNSNNQGYIAHFEVAGTAGSAIRPHGISVDEPGAWPMFHHDPQLTGDTGTALNVEVPCSPPPSPPSGYYLAAGDGGVFTFGSLPFCGSLGSLVLNKPIVGIARTADGGGYWMVASDGGIFAFGDARFYGSMGGQTLNKPIVAMAPTPDGGGYWLVAADGGIFAFGDARFYGSTGGITLAEPIVGMTPTADGHGYWLVAADGGIFAFGDAGYHGSMGGQHLNAPIVAMAADPATGGYWLVGSDGGVFSFAAPYLGSTGDLHLNAPIVGMGSTSGGDGYRFVAADGGIFSFGASPFYGSMGGQHLNQPIVAVSGF